MRSSRPVSYRLKNQLKTLGRAFSATVLFARCLLATAAPSSTESAPVLAKATPSLSCSSKQTLPTQFQLDYAVTASRSGFVLQGDNKLIWQVVGERYQLRSVTRSILFSAQQSSQGQLKGALLKPTEYIEKRPRREAVVVSLDWQAQQVSFSGGQPAVPTDKGMQDRLSMLLQLSIQARRQPQAAVEFNVAGARRTSLYRFEPRGAETLDIAAGRFESFKFEQPRDEQNDGLEVWLAPALCWLPVKLRFTDDRNLVVQDELRAAHRELQAEEPKDND